MAQTEGRYPVINKDRAVGAVATLWAFKKNIDFLRDYDPRTAVQMTPPPFKLTHNQYTLMLGRATRTAYATIHFGGTLEEVERAVKFAFVMIDAEKYLLDVDEAKEKYDFKELEDKYVRGVKSE